MRYLRDDWARRCEIGYADAICVLMLDCPGWLTERLMHGHLPGIPVGGDRPRGLIPLPAVVRADWPLPERGDPRLAVTDRLHEKAAGSGHQSIGTFLDGSVHGWVEPVVGLRKQAKQVPGCGAVPVLGGGRVEVPTEASVEDGYDVERAVQAPCGYEAWQDLLRVDAVGFGAA
ncbi:MAG: hypothetical protein FWF43_09460 [Propionibacteriaceae bacterium]|nr:hypothetical protein [Propionibacteriaceae bacterium]